MCFYVIIRPEKCTQNSFLAYFRKNVRVKHNAPFSVYFFLSGRSVERNRYSLYFNNFLLSQYNTASGNVASGWCTGENTGEKQYGDGRDEQIRISLRNIPDSTFGVPLCKPLWHSYESGRYRMHSVTFNLDDTSE